MTAKDKLIQDIATMRANVLATEYLSEERKAEVIEKLDTACQNIPDSACGSPEMVLALSIMRDALLEGMTVMLNSLPREIPTT